MTPVRQKYVPFTVFRLSRRPLIPRLTKGKFIKNGAKVNNISCETCSWLLKLKVKTPAIYWRLITTFSFFVELLFCLLHSRIPSRVLAKIFLRQLYYVFLWKYVTGSQCQCDRLTVPISNANLKQIFFLNVCNVLKQHNIAK